MSRSFLQRLADSCEKHAERTAMRVVRLPEETYTYERMFREIRNVAGRLRASGVSKGDRVAVFGENHPCWAISYLAILYAEAVCVPIDPHGETGTISNFLSDSEAKLVFTSAASLERLPEIEKKIGRAVQKVVWRSEAVCSEDTFEDWAGSSGNGSFEPDASGADNALLIYTSGTTGRPKGVLLSHSNICAELDAVDRVLEVSPEERILSLLPLFHAYLQIAALWIASTKGCEVIYLKELTPEELSRAMKESRMTILASVPRLWYLIHKKIFDEVRRKGRGMRWIFASLLKTNGFLRDTIGWNLGRFFFRPVHDSLGGELRLAISAGSRFDEDVARDFHRLGFTILQAYGLTETSGAATATPIDDNRVGSVGKPVLGAEVKIAGNGDGEEGEVLIRGPMVFEGYYRNPEATREAFDDEGWFRSGDLGRFDGDGHLYITGRAKDVIVLPSGKNVHPEDLEVQYLKSPLVAEICVIGISDSSIGRQGAEKLVAVAVPDFDYLKKKGVANAREAIRFDLDGLGRDLPEYQRVRDYIVRTEPLPRTATNKIKRFELATEYSNGDGSESASVPTRVWDFDEADTRLMAGAEGRIAAESLAAQGIVDTEIHPDMNLEIDLRLDSLARAEVFARLEQACGREFDAEEIASALKVRDVVALLSESGPAPGAGGGERLEWGTILTTVDELQPETRAILRRRTLFSILAFAVLKAFYLFCRIFLRLKVEGRQHLQTEKPYLICPNHQSYLDAFVVCSTYPYSVLKDIFHVGASEYFEGPVTRHLASLLNIVPIDPDTHLLRAMKAGAGGLKRGKILNIYPEGERTFDGRLHKFKDGASILSTELGLPIVPVALDGLYEVWGRGSNRIRSGKVTIRFGEPIKPPNVDSKKKSTAYGRHTSELRSAIEKMLEEIRERGVPRADRDNLIDSVVRR
ncbi:MAG: AMP-binding protein [Aridibacter famidurans]|nr:AMP-binding protein [Aridibacter famidurans]